MGNKKHKHNMNVRVELLQINKKNIVKATIFIAGVIVTLLITKACDRIIPDSPVVVEKIPDTIKIVHVYEPLADSVLDYTIKTTEDIVKKAIDYRPKNESLQYSDNYENVNHILKSVSFPNAKGYTVQSAAPYFSLEMSELNQPFVDFIYHFFNENQISDIYCLSIKVFRVQNGESVYVLDENYSIKKGLNIIRMNNIFTSGDYEVEVGFIFLNDVNSKYPNFYREVRYINNSLKKE